MTPLGDRSLRSWLLTGASIYVAIVVVVVLALINLHSAAQQRLDEALGDRLLGTAVTASYLVDGDAVADWAFDPESSLDFLWLRSRLEQIRRENGLSEVCLCDTTGFVLISAARRLARGDLNVFWTLDPGAVASAREGFAAATRLYRGERVYQKSAHAPVRDSQGAVAAVLTVEAEADFFRSLELLRRGALLTGAGVVVFLAMLGLLLRRQQLVLARYRETALRQENLAAMGRMTAAIAHEVRNPLTIIRGAADHLRGRLREAGIEDETSAFIPDEVDRMDRILSRYLTFGRGDVGEFELLDLVRLAQRSTQMLEDELARDGVRVSFASMGPARPVSGDAPRLQQVLMNLLLNAGQAMPEGGDIEVRLDWDGDGVVLSVADRGHGLRGQSGEQLFAPFHTTREKGSGLGLAVVKGIVEEHGGAIRLRDRDDGPGAVAEVRLPVPRS